MSYKDKNGLTIKDLDCCIYRLSYEESQGGQLPNEIDYISVKDYVYYFGDSVLTEDLAKSLEIIGRRR